MRQSRTEVQFRKTIERKETEGKTRRNKNDT